MNSRDDSEVFRTRSGKGEECPSRGSASSLSPHLDADRFVDLWGGWLSAQASAEALDHLAACPECEELFRDCVRQAERLRATCAGRAVAGGGVRETAPGSTAAGTPRARRHAAVWDALRSRRRWSATVAASLAAAALVLLLLPRSVTPPEGLERLPAFAPAPALRSETASRSAILSAGFAAYAHGQDEIAIENLQRVEAEGQIEIARRLYLASALAWRDRCREAAALLRGLPLRELPDPWAACGTWTLYTCAREAGLHAEAEALLRALSGEAGPDGERARQMLARKR